MSSERLDDVLMFIFGSRNHRFFLCLVMKKLLISVPTLDSLHYQSTLTDIQISKCNLDPHTIT
jgi:hypothetical protein